MEISQLPQPEIVSMILSLAMCFLYTLMKLYVKNSPDKYDKAKAFLEFPINLCCIFTTALVAVEVSKGIDFKIAIIIFILATIISFVCCIFRKNANISLFKENARLSLICWAILDWGLSLSFGSVLIIYNWM